MPKVATDVVLKAIENDYSMAFKKTSESRFIPILTARPTDAYESSIFIHDTLDCAGESSFNEHETSSVVCVDANLDVEIWRRDRIAPLYRKIITCNEVECRELVISLLGEGNVHVVTSHAGIRRYIENLSGIEVNTHQCIAGSVFNREEYLKKLDFDDTRIDFQVPDLEFGTNFPVGTLASLSFVPPGVVDIEGFIRVSFPKSALPENHYDIMTVSRVREDTDSLEKGDITQSEIRLLDGWEGPVVASWRVANNRRAITLSAPFSFFDVVSRLFPTKMC